MKIKVISLMLILSLFISLFSVYTFASDLSTVAEDNVNYAKTYLHYLNTYGDSTDDCGGGLGFHNATNSTYELQAEENGNKYGYYNFNDKSSNVYMQLTPSGTYNISPSQLGYMIFEFDINDFGEMITTKKFLEVHSGSGSLSTGERVAAADILNIANDSNGNYFYFNNSKTKKIYIDSNEWVHVRCEFSVLSTSATKYNLRCYIGDQYFESTFKFGNTSQINIIRFGSSSSTNQRMGFDNIALYSSKENLSSYTEVKASQASLVMKIGAENASLNFEQIELTSVPMLINGKIYCPVDVIERLTGITCPEIYLVSLDGASYININNVKTAFGVEAESYDMGLILIGKEENLLDDDASYEEMISLMQGFIFNIPSSNELISDVNKNTSGFDHPYLLADADRFAELRAIYTVGKNNRFKNDEEKMLYTYISSYISSAESQYTSYCGTKVTGTYNGLKADKIPVNANYNKYNNNGYDNGGRVSVPTGPLLYFAFAYQMTENLNYAKAAYDYMLALGDWNHWGPGHFLNCADTAAPFSIAYDWIYDAIDELNKSGAVSKYDSAVYENTKLATILFTHVIIPGYIQSNNISCPWPGTVDSRYATKTNNWNAVCTSGVVMAALLLLNEDISTAGMTFATQKKSGSTFTQTTTKIEEIGSKAIHAGLNTYSDYAAKLATMNLNSLAKYGLGQYAPDGSYVESPGYWSYGTNTLFRLVASLLSATGDDYGFMDTWGLDTTCYFAVHSESSDYKTWNFNDGSVGVQDSSFFFFVGDFYGDDNLVRVRKKQLEGGKSSNLYDILFYDTSITGDPELSKDYLMAGIDAYSVRSSWDKGALYAGLIGGANNASHGQMDAGSFVYHNNGKIWFHDIGTDNYNYSGGYFSNYKLYRIGAEGHNLIAVTSEQRTLPYGQTTNANPPIVDTYSTVDGAYAVLDLSDTYGTHVKEAKRGMLLTNSRSTIVIQDEFVFNGKKTAYWFGHYQIAEGYVDDVVISADGRTAFMFSDDDILRVSIVSDNQDLKFEIMDCYTYVLDATIRTDRTTMDGLSTEYNRDSLRKLAIKCENVETLNLAVVIESVNETEIGCGYEYTSISNWEVKAYGSVIDEKFTADFQPENTVVGSYHLESSDGSYVLENYEYNTKSYLGVLPNSATSGEQNSALKLLFKKNTGIELSKNKYVSFDFDVFTENSFFDGTKLGINLKNSTGTSGFVTIAELKDNEIIIGKTSLSIDKTWTHISVIINIENGYAYLYSNNDYISKVQCISSSEITHINNFEFILPANSAGDYCASLLLDNISVRAFALSYDSSEISSIISNSLSLDNWTDAIDFQSINRPLAIANESYLYNNADIESAINEGKNIKLLRNTTGIINVSNAITVDTQGYRFNYKSDSYFPVVNGNTFTFKANTVTVRWHIDDTVFTENYTGASIATFKEYSNKVGVISYTVTEYSQGGVSYKFYTTGWSNIPGGKALAQDEMIVSESNCDFWLVNNVPVSCLFATIDATGNVYTFNNESKLREFITSNDDYKIILCKDVELKNTSSIPLSKSGKTIYLNGYTLSHKQYDIHTFTYQYNTMGDFRFVGPGVFEAYSTRAIFTSSSGTNDVTSPYGIVAENITIKTDTMLADLRIGQHRFINCNIYQINQPKKTFIALWNKNQNANADGPINLLTVTFDGCNINCSAPATSSVFSYSANTYSEIYLKNSVLTANGILFDATNAVAKFSASDGSSISVGKFYNESSIRYTNIFFDNGVKTNFTVDAKFMPSDAILTNNFDTAFPYRVSANNAHLTWTDLSGNTLHSEYVAVGVTPKITAQAVIDYLKSLNGLYTYDLKEIDSKSPTVFTPVLKTAVTIFHSMSIEEDLSIYFYIEKSEMESKISSVKVDNVRIMNSSYKLVEMNGTTYYMYKISSFTPSNACTEVTVTLERTDGKTQRYVFSVINYLDSLLSISQDENEKILAVKILKYIQSAYAYFNSADVNGYEKVSALINKYKSYDLIYGDLKSESTATGVLKDTIRSACFNLSGSIRIRFLLNPSYTGEISVTLNGDTDVYYVKDGKINGYDYIEIVIPPELLNDFVLISNGTNSLEYGLGTYSAALNNSDSKLQKMLLCMSEYSSAAKKYISNK